jgi:hypothetical protein
MNFYLAGLKALHEVGASTPWPLAAPGIVAGAALVWVAAALALYLGAGRAGALTAGVVVAVNPVLVAYGGTIRSYIFLALFSTATITALYRWRLHGRWRDGMLCGVCGALALLAHLNAVYTYVVTAVLAAGWTVSEPGPWAVRARKLTRLAVPVLGMALLVGIAYLPQLPDIARFRARWSDTPPIALTFVPTVVSRVFGAGYAVLPAVALLAYAAWRACRDRRDSQWMLLAVVLLVAAISLAGVSHYPWAYTRFLVAGIPWLIVLMADGVAVLTTHSRLVGGLAVGAVAAASLVGLTAERGTLHARPWQSIAQYLRHDAASNDRCLVLGDDIFQVPLKLYGAACDLDAVDILTAIPADRPVRLRVVVMPGKLDIAGETRRFGQVRVLELSGSPGSVAAALSQVLIDGARERVVDDFAHVYGQLAALARWSGPATDAEKYILLRERCRALYSGARAIRRSGRAY